jgi:DNA-binding winged helix-turn-helix (wHTH) protein
VRAVPGAWVELSPLATRLLLYLAHNRDRVVSKDELLREVGRDVRVTESSLYQALLLSRNP